MSRTSNTNATRNKSPQPLRSPSPDYVANSTIICSRSPSSAEIVELSGLTISQHWAPLL
jgi:hypothetical protein